MKTVLTPALLAVCFALPQEPPAPPPGPSAELVDRDGQAMQVTDLVYAVEEAEAGMVFVTRMPYLPLRTGRGEWRVPLAQIRSITVGETPAPPALLSSVERRGVLQVSVDREGRATELRGAAGLGDPALDAAVGALVKQASYRGGRGPADIAARPVRLDVRLRVTEIPDAPSVRSPRLQLHLADGSDLEGELTVVGTLVGKAGAGEYRLALADCGSATLTPAPK